MSNYCSKTPGEENAWCPARGGPNDSVVPMCASRCAAFQNLIESVNNNSMYAERRLVELQGRIYAIEEELAKVLGWTRKGD